MGLFFQDFRQALLRLVGELPDELTMEDSTAVRAALYEASLRVEARSRDAADTPPDFISPEEAADYAGVSRALVVRWARTGPPWAFHPSPRLLHVWRAAFIRWVRSRRKPLTRARAVASTVETARTGPFATVEAPARAPVRARGGRY